MYESVLLPPKCKTYSVLALGYVKKKKTTKQKNKAKNLINQVLLDWTAWKAVCSF